MFTKGTRPSQLCSWDDTSAEHTPGLIPFHQIPNDLLHYLELFFLVVQGFPLLLKATYTTLRILPILSKTETLQWPLQLGISM